MVIKNILITKPAPNFFRIYFFKNLPIKHEKKSVTSQHWSEKCVQIFFSKICYTSLLFFKKKLISRFLRFSFFDIKILENFNKKNLKI
jgi:hypothetical protein